MIAVLGQVFLFVAVILATIMAGAVAAMALSPAFFETIVGAGREVAATINEASLLLWFWPRNLLRARRYVANHRPDSWWYRWSA